jgi:MYXO-CTERM domain-containing protein
MKLKNVIASIAFAAAAPLPALAQSVTLDFEGTSSFLSIFEFYNGGTDQGGLAGANYGVSFTGDALGLQNDELGPYFANAPSPTSVMFSAPGGLAFMNVASGFSGALQFAYSSVNPGAVVNIYSELNGAGTLLASYSLGANAQNGCSSAGWCHFDTANIAFAGTARSVDFGTNAGYVAFDNVNVSPVPEPSSMALALAGFGVIAAIARRRRR